jgi:streptomycin 6-kinase
MAFGHAGAGSTPVELPAGLTQRVSGLDGGVEWLRALPALLDIVSRRWGVTIHEPFPNLTYNYVAPVIYSDGTEAVLKAGIPNDEFRQALEALKAYSGQYAVLVLDADVELGVLSLERPRPGTPLTSLANDEHDEEATSIAASVMRGLWRPAPAEHSLPSVYNWGRGFETLRARFDGGAGPLPAQMVEEAEMMYSVPSGATLVLLHGDLHHDNIISADRQPWLAIDPKGVIGEPAYEAGALLRNLWQERYAIADPKRTTERRIYQLADELGLNRTRIRDWTTAQSVLSAWWGIEDGGDWRWAIAHAEMLKSLKV